MLQINTTGTQVMGGTIQSLGLSAGALMLLWDIGIASITDLFACSEQELGKRLRNSSVAVPKKQIASILAEVQKHRTGRVDNKCTSPGGKAAKRNGVHFDTCAKDRTGSPQYGPDPMWLLQSAIRMHPLLSRKEERELATRVWKHGDKAARDSLVLHNIRLVMSIARKKPAPAILMSYQDRIQEGMLGLLKAIDEFNPNLGNKLSTYATWWIKQAIGRAIEDAGHIRLPVHINEFHKKVTDAAEAIAEAKGRLPSTDEIAALLKEKPKKVERAIRRMRMQVVSIETPLPGGKNDSNPQLLQDVVLDDSKLDPLQVLEAQAELAIAISQVDSLLDALYDSGATDRDRSVFVLYYGLDRSFEGRTLEKVGEEFDVSRERVRQIVKNLWHRLDRREVNIDHASLLRLFARIRDLENLTHKLVGST